MYIPCNTVAAVPKSCNWSLYPPFFIWLLLLLLVFVLRYMVLEPKTTLKKAVVILMLMGQATAQAPLRVLVITMVITKEQITARQTANLPICTFDAATFCYVGFITP